MSVSTLALAACDPQVGIIDPNPLRIQTDSTRYTAVPVGHGQFVVRVQTTFHNTKATPVTIDRCGPTATSPVYAVLLTWPVSVEGPGYAPTLACVGNDSPIVVDAGAMRTDTLVLRGPNQYDNTSQKYLGVIAGNFRVGYGGGLSNEFEIRVP